MAAKSDLIILGAGGHGRVCADVATAAGFTVVAFCDADPNVASEINGIPAVPAADVSAVAARFDSSQHGLVVALGDNDVRMRCLRDAEMAGFGLPAIIHPGAVVSPTAMIGPGTVVVAGAVVNANARIGRGCILNTACSVDHDSVLDDGVQICPGVHAAGDAHFGERAFVGTGAVIVPRVRIGQSAVVAAGALVSSDVGDGERVGPSSS